MSDHLDTHEPNEQDEVPQIERRPLTAPQRRYMKRLLERRNEAQAQVDEYFDCLVQDHDCGDGSWQFDGTTFAFLRQKREG